MKKATVCAMAFNLGGRGKRGKVIPNKSLKRLKKKMGFLGVF